MSTTSKHRNHLVEESAQRGSRSALPGGISMVAYALILLYYATLLSRHDVSQLILLIGVTSLPVLMGVLSMELQQRRDSHLGTWLFVGSMLLVAPVTATAVVNLGVILGIAGAISAAQIASRTLSSHQIPRAIGAGVVSSIATVLVDRFWPGQRLVFATAGFVVPAIAAGLILANGFIIAGRYREFSIGAKLITSTVVLTALSLAVLTAFVGHNARRILMADVGRDLDRLAESQAVAVSELLGRESARLELLGQSQALQSRLQLANAAYPGVAGRVREKIETSAASWAAASQSNVLAKGIMDEVVTLELRAFRDAFPSHLELLVTDRYGALLASTDRTVDYVHAEAAWWKSAYRDGLGASIRNEPVPQASMDIMGLQLAVPVRDTSSGDLLGILHTLYNMDALNQALSAATVGETGRGFLLLPTGEMYNAFTREIVEAEPETLAQLMPVRESRPDETEIGGQSSLVGQAPVGRLGQSSSIEELGWTIVAPMAKAEALAPAQQLQGNLTLLSIVVLAVISSITAIMAENLTGSLARLTQTALQLEAGDLSAQASVDSRDEIGRLAVVFNNITRQLRQTVARLERQVTHRTHALEASVQVSRTLSSILDQEQLVSEVVEQVRSAFGYYHAHIYLIDETSGDLIMAGGTGLAGKTMLDAGHRISKRRGLVGRAASTKEVVLAPNVKKERDWLSNPLLPDTEAEIAVPIAIRGQVLGVLDIQHDVVGGLTEEDTRLLQSVANQVAIALRNARLYEEAQQQAERQKLINAINQKIHGANTIEEVLQVTVTELGQALGVERASVQLGFSKAPSNGKS